MREICSYPHSWSSCMGHPRISISNSTGSGICDSTRVIIPCPRITLGRDFPSTSTCREMSLIPTILDPGLVVLLTVHIMTSEHGDLVVVTVGKVLHCLRPLGRVHV